MRPAAMIRNVEPGEADQLNAVRDSAPQLEAALEVLAPLPAHLRARPAAQALALQA